MIPIGDAMTNLFRWKTETTNVNHLRWKKRTQDELQTKLTSLLIGIINNSVLLSTPSANLPVYFSKLWHVGFLGGGVKVRYHVLS